MTSLTLRQQFPNFIEDVKQWSPFPPKRDFLTGADAVFIAVERPELLAQIGAVFYFSKRIEPEVVKTQVEQYMRRAGGRYMQRIVKNEWMFGRPYFEDVGDDYSIDNHFEYVVVPEPATDSQVASIVADRQSQPLDLAHPLMKATYLDGIDGSFGLIWRVHHALADGQGFQKGLTTYLATLDPVTGLPPTIDSLTDPSITSTITYKAGRRKSVPASKLTRTARVGPAKIIPTLLTQMVVVVYGVVVFLLNMLYVATRATGLTGRKGLWHAEPAKQRGFVTKQIAWTQEMSLADVKRVKNLLGCTVNDVLLAAAAGGVSKYLAEKGQLKDDNLVMIVPCSLRRPTDFAISNESSSFFVTLPTKIKDPLLRLRSVQGRMNSLKRSLEPVVIYWFQKLAFMFPYLVSKEVIIFGSRWLHGFITNVPGPAKAMVWPGGATVIRFIPIAPCLANALGVVIHSYVDHVSISCTTDLDESLADGECYGAGTAMEVSRAIEEEFLRTREEADASVTRMVRDMVANVGLQAVEKEVERMKVEGAVKG